MATGDYGGTGDGMKGSAVIERGEYPLKPKPKCPGEFLAEIQGLWDQYQPDDPSRRKLTTREADLLYSRLTRLKEAFDKLPESDQRPHEENFYTWCGDLELLCEEAMETRR